MRTIQVMLATSEYEFSHGHGPRGHGHWAFEFAASYFDIERLKLACQAANASHQNGRICSVDVETYAPNRVVIWIHGALYSEAKHGAVAIAKLGARDGVSTIVGQVGS